MQMVFRCGILLLFVPLLCFAQLPEIEGLVSKGGGSTVHRKSEGGVEYSLYVPGSTGNESFADRTAIVLLHGAGDNSQNFMTSWTSYPFAPRWIAISVNAKADAAWQAGEEKRVMEVLDEVESEHSIRRVFVGGFSRGAGFSYNVALAAPERFDGILSLAGNVWNPGLIKPVHARKLAIAIVHGDADTIIPPKHGQDAHDRFQNAGYRTYLKIIEDWAHVLHGSETEKALDWLDENASPLKTPDDYYTYAMASFKEGRYAQAAWALRTIDTEENQGESFYKKIALTMKKIESKSEKKARKLLKDITADKNGKWLKDWRAYEKKFGGTAQHEKVNADVQALAEKHQSTAEKLYEEAVVARGLSDFEKAIKKCFEIRDRCYLSTGEPVSDAKDLLDEFRNDPEVAKKHRSLLRKAW